MSSTVDGLYGGVAKLFPFSILFYVSRQICTFGAATFLTNHSATPVRRADLGHRFQTVYFQFGQAYSLDAAARSGAS